MSNWWQMTDDDVEAEPQTQLDRQRAHRQTFMVALHGKHVFANMRRMAFTYSVPGASVSEEAVGRMALVDFMDRIRELCGVEDELAVIDAEAQASQFYEAPEEEKPEPDLLEPD